MSQKEEFVAFLTRSIGEIPQDVKILFEMLDDGELGDQRKTRVAGSLLYLLAPGDLVPDTFGLLGHVDDSLMFRMTMAATVEEEQERRGHYAQRYPEVFDFLEDDLSAARGFLGDIYHWLESRLDTLAGIEFKGKRPPLFVEDIEERSWLYDEVNEAMLDFEYDEEELAPTLRKIDRIIPIMRQKMEASKR